MAGISSRRRSIGPGYILAWIYTRPFGNMASRQSSHSHFPATTDDVIPLTLCDDTATYILSCIFSTRSGLKQRENNSSISLQATPSSSIIKSCRDCLKELGSVRVTLLQHGWLKRLILNSIPNLLMESRTSSCLIHEVEIRMSLFTRWETCVCGYLHGWICLCD